MNVLIIGSGAREHCIAKALKKSSQLPFIFCCGNSNNPGIQQIAVDYSIVDICNVYEILQHALTWKIDLAIIGPEAPLEKGLADILWQHKIPVIGPTKKLAQLETSKAFTRNLLKQYSIEGSPQYRVFNTLNGAEEFLLLLGEGNYVIKANGLMGGKGVKVAGEHLHSIREALEFCVEIINHGQNIVIEEKLIGQEFSLLCFCDGTNLVPMPAIQDHKRAYINDTGPNTGGMGSYSDANHSLPFLTAKDLASAQQINAKVIQALMQECDEKYIGILYGSFIATEHGVSLIEFNTRFGDPEVMNVLSVLETDFLAICQAMIQGQLAEQSIRFKNLATVCKYAVPQGYPDMPAKNFPIDVTKVNSDCLYLGAVDGYLATGSRTAAVVGVAPTLEEAEKLAQLEIERIQGNLFHRADIGTDALIQKRIKHMQELRLCLALEL